jgi:hypothetical protein
MAEPGVILVGAGIISSTLAVRDVAGVLPARQPD